MNKSDAKTIMRGLRRVAVALITAATFVTAIAGFIAVGFTRGYLAVLLFLASLMILGIAFILLYAQGIGPKTYTESKGEKNEYDITL